MKTILTLVLASLSMTAADTDRPATLYQRLGGQAAVTAVVDDFVTRVLADGRVNHWFEHAAADPARAAAYKAMLGDFVCQAAGGPCKYKGKDMVAAHKGRAVTGPAFEAVVQDLTATLQHLHVPAKEQRDLMALLGPLQTAIVSVP